MPELLVWTLFEGSSWNTSSGCSKRNGYQGSVEFLLSGYEIKSTCMMEEGTVPVPPQTAPALKSDDDVFPVQE
jgi:hypothetical protein